MLYTIFKYIVSGGTAALIDLFVLNFLDSIGIHYILSVNIAFIIAFGVSFSLQKYWTFRNAKDGKTHHQALIYLIVSIINAFLNTTIIHFLLSMNLVNGFLFLKPVVIAQIISGIIVAIESFVIYRFLIFRKDKNDSENTNIFIRMKNSTLRKYIIAVLSILGFIILLYFSFSKLTETPPIWMDEGIIIQTARNFSNFGFSGLRIDPDTIVSSGYVTTSYPVTLPIAGVFSIFGISLFNARIVMVIFILLLVLFSLVWLKRNISSNIWILLFSFFIIITFPPLYGHGKNVLGEIPGLFFLFLSMISLELTYNSYVKQGFTLNKKIFNTIVTSFLIGIVVSTKPIFILILPAILVVLIFYIYKNRSYFVSNKKDILLIFLSSIISFFIPIILWIIFQFHGETLSQMLSIYANPHNTNIVNSIFINLKRFFKEGQPIYTLIITLIWTIILFIRLRKRNNIKISELILYSFNIIVLFAYLRTTGYYRYFFLGEFISIVMISKNLFYLANNKISKIIISCLCIFIIIFQFYQLNNSSWIAQYRKSNQTSDINKSIVDIPVKKEIFVYQAPEIVTFIKGENYSQFMSITYSIKVGEKSLQRIRNRIADIIIVNSDQNYLDIINDLSNNGYITYNLIGKYRFLMRI